MKGPEKTPKKGLKSDKKGILKEEESKQILKTRKKQEKMWHKKPQKTTKIKNEAKKGLKNR